MINTPYGGRAYQPQKIEIKSVSRKKTKRLWGQIHPKASQILIVGNLAVLALTGFRSMVLRRHLSVTLPLR
jgi:hypothetical protein